MSILCHISFQCSLSLTRNRHQFPIQDLFSWVMSVACIHSGLLFSRRLSASGISISCEFIWANNLKSLRFRFAKFSKSNVTAHARWQSAFSSHFIHCHISWIQPNERVCEFKTLAFIRTLGCPSIGDGYTQFGDTVNWMPFSQFSCRLCFFTLLCVFMQISVGVVYFYEHLPTTDEWASSMRTTIGQIILPFCLPFRFLLAVSSLIRCNFLHMKSICEKMCCITFWHGHRWSAMLWFAVTRHSDALYRLVCDLKRTFPKSTDIFLMLFFSKVSFFVLFWPCPLRIRLSIILPFMTPSDSQGWEHFSVSTYAQFCISHSFISHQIGIAFLIPFFRLISDTEMSSLSCSDKRLVGHFRFIACRSF